MNFPFRTMRGALSWLRLRLSRKEAVRRGSCRRCGRCCSEILLWTNGAWLGSERDFARMVKDQPRYARFHVVDRDGDGRLLLSCDRLTADNTCSDYDDRMEFCRDYPNTEQYLDYGGVSSGCGYRFEVAPRFAGVFAQALREAERSADADHDELFIDDDEHRKDEE